MPPLVIAAGISAAGAIGGAAISSRGAGKAADEQARAAAEAGKLGTEAAGKAGQLITDATGKVIDISKQGVTDANAILKAIYEGDLAKLQPYFDAGYEGLKQLTEGLKPGGYFTEQYPYFKFDAADFAKEPGYEFRKAEGQKALERSQAARGGLLGGAGVKEAMRYNQEFASNEFGNAYSRAANTYGMNFDVFSRDRQARFDRLAALAGFGERATGQALALGENYGGRAAGNIMEGAGTQANATMRGAELQGNYLMEGARQGQEAITGAANARASGYVSRGNIWGNAANQIANVGADYLNTRYGKPPTVQGQTVSIGGKIYSMGVGGVNDISNYDYASKGYVNPIRGQVKMDSKGKWYRYTGNAWLPTEP